MRTIWGFDLGVASIGFAVIRWDEWASKDGAGEILRLGVRVFPESREADHTPKNAARRQARLARRQSRRRRWRRVHLRALLAEAGLLPAADAKPHGGQDPVCLRERGLREALAPHEIGWSLFHLLKRRGFQGSRKRTDAKDALTPEEKRAAAEEKKTEDNATKFADWLGDRPLAVGLATIISTIERPQRRRDRGHKRQMVADELEILWAEQRQHYPELLTEDLRKRIEDVALAQRPTFFRRRTIGRCSLEPDEERALKAEWLTQQFEMLQLVNGLRLEGGNQRGLDARERAKAIAYLESEINPTWAGLRKAIGLPRGAAFTHERGKKETVRGNATEAALRAALGPGFPRLASADVIREEIGRAWHLLEYRPAKDGAILEIRDAAGIAEQRTALARRAQTEWGLSPEQAGALAAIDLKDGTGQHSLKAMRRLLRYLEAGDPYTTARERFAEYTLRESGEPVTTLPGPNPSELTRIEDRFVRGRMEALLAGVRNPTVLRTLGELQKVVNALLRKYGRPDLIRIEFARELKQSGKERRDTDIEQQRRERARRDARKKLAELGKASEGREGEENVLRLLLWQEQGQLSPFSGQTICCADAMDGSATEIEHIFPISRSFDDSQANKVLCLLRENRDKGNRTPFEWLSGQEDRWAHLSGIVWKTMTETGWPEAKRRRFLKAQLEDADSEAFSNRQLTDTSFVARAARGYLGLLFGGGQSGMNGVQTVPGRATAQLRRAWGIGLSRLLHGEIEGATKSRDDHRHHAIDALVVALTGPGTVHVLSRWWQIREMTMTRPPIRWPWAEFRESVKQRVEAIVVSQRVQSKLSGPLHEDTRFGDKGAAAEEGFRYYAKRKAVAALSPNEILGEGRGATKIADGGVQAAILAHLRSHGIHRVKAADKRKLAAALAEEVRLPRADGSAGPIIRRVRLWQKLQPELIARVHSTRNIFATPGPGSNHHIAIYRAGDRVWGTPVLKRQAIERVRRGERIVLPAEGDGKLVMSLCRGDVVRRTVGETTEYRVIRKFNAAQRIFFKPLTMAGEPEKEGSWSPEGLLRDGWHKVSIDPIGCTRRAR